PTTGSTRQRRSRPEGGGAYAAETNASETGCKGHRHARVTSHRGVDLELARGQDEPEARAALSVRARAGADAAAVCLDDGAGDRQAEPAAAARATDLRLVPLVEHAAGFAGGDAAAGILDGAGELSADGAAGAPDAPA